MKATRTYVMRARAEAADGTRQRILDAAVQELWNRRVTEVRLEDVAARAQVTVQSALRIYGSKSKLLELALRPLREEIMRQRASAQPGDVDGTIAALFDHYERMGDFVIRNLAEEHTLPEMGEMLESGRKAHRQSMVRQFGPQLAGREDRKLMLDCLVVACDVYTWKLLRRDAGRSRKEAHACVRRLVDAILEVA
jgi:AcrR family transcriptional regulator